jgi:hypothetical protein
MIPNPKARILETQGDTSDEYQKHLSKAFRVRSDEIG